MAKLSNVDVVIMALGELGGAESRIHTEEIADKCKELSPSQFSWILPQYSSRSWPDKFVTKCSLEDAKKVKYGRLIEGVCSRDIQSDGWALTVEGAIWLRKHRQRIQKALDGNVIQHHSRRDDKKQITQMRKHELVVAFLHGHKIDSSDKYRLFDLLNCSPDAPGDIVSLRTKNFVASAELAGDEDIIKFVKQCEAALPELFRNTRDGGER